MDLLGLITDRTQENVDYLKKLSAKGWANMTPYEQALWTGDPLTAADWGYSDPVNILPNRVDYSDGVSVLFRNEYFTATGTGTVTIVIGAADDFIGKTVTLSASNISSVGYLELAWYNSEEDYESAPCRLSSSGGMSALLNTSIDTWEYLVMRIHVSGVLTCQRVMLELGNTQHDYVPYIPILPTLVTRGAYNYSDLNRVERAVEELSEKLGLGLTTKTDWGLWDVPTASDMSRFRGNLAVIGIECFGADVLADVSNDLSKMTYAHANQIEKFLLSVSELEEVSE